MLLLWGLPDDGPIERMYQILLQKNIPTVFINQYDVLDYEFEMTFDDGFSGVIRSSAISVNIKDIHSLYIRPYDLRQLGLFENDDPTNADWKRSMQFQDMLFLWSEIAEARVVNRPSSAGSNTSKPYQLDLLRKHGLRVPETIITTDPECVREFWHVHKRVIYKSISSQRSIVSELKDTDEDRINDVIWCPTQFQEYIGGVDYRVHVLGDRTFVSRICSSSTDYRYGKDTQITSADLPEDIHQKCLDLTKNMGLLFSGIDLRRSEDGEWYCFEVNPSPGYTYFEDATDKHISYALAEYLSQ